MEGSARRMIVPENIMPMACRPRVRQRMPVEVAVLIVAICALALAGCTGNYQLVPRSDDAGTRLAWFTPRAPRDARALARWREAVGPVLVTPPPPTVVAPSDELTIVSWNTAVGAGDVLRLVKELRKERHTPIVLLLQEVYRAGPDVPEVVDDDAAFASHLGGPDAPRHDHEDIAAIAAMTGLQAYYAPSMRNGGGVKEDRGNAILSSLPLSAFTAIELPFERQRRVAVAATVQGLSPEGIAWTMRVVSAHLDNVSGPRRLWVLGSEWARIRQARSLAAWVSDSFPTVLGADLNTWAGFSDGAYEEMARAFHAPMPRDRRPTFLGLLRLDHLFFRLPRGWRATFERGSSRLGSDHYPLIARVDIE
jgi:endonuclease/exonuclease/phosphatase family metal-dependent hydrolase